MIEAEAKASTQKESNVDQLVQKIEEEKKGREVSEVETRSEAMRLSETRM